MSAYRTKFRKRRSDDESSGSDRDTPPVKRRRPVEATLKLSLFEKCRQIYNWIGDNPISYLKTRTMYKAPIEEIIDNDDLEDEDIIPINKDIADIVNLKLAEKEESVRGLGSFNGFSKLQNTSTPFFRDGTMVGYNPSLSSTNGYHSKVPKSKDSLRKLQKLRGSSNRCLTPITNPGKDIEIVMDSRETSAAVPAELEIVSEVSHTKCSSNFSRPLMSPISGFNGDSAATSGTPCRSVMNGKDSLPSTSRQNSSFSKDKFGSTNNQLIRLTEKEKYSTLLKKMMAKVPDYCSKENREKPVIQVDLTQDEDEESVLGLPFRKEYLQAPVGEFMESYYKPCRMVKKASSINIKLKNPYCVNLDIKRKTVALPEYRRKLTKPDLFSDNWIKELKATIEEKTEKHLQVVKQQEDKVKRFRDRRDAEFQKEKLLFEKYKVPGDVFEEAASDQNDYPDFTTEMENIIDSGLQDGCETEQMCTMNKITILRKHLATLDGNNWLIDEILNFYLNLIVERSKLDNYPSAYTFSTFFYSSLRTRGIPAAQRWTRKMDIFSYDIIFIPLHLEVHWALCVIDNRSKTIKYYDSMGSGHNNNIIKPVHAFVIAEKKSKKNMDPQEYELEVVKGLPKQMNGSDCGMFTLKYAEYISRDAPITFEQVHITYFRRRMVYEILTQQLL